MAFLGYVAGLGCESTASTEGLDFDTLEPPIQHAGTRLPPGDGGNLDCALLLTSQDLQTICGHASEPHADPKEGEGTVLCTRSGGFGQGYSFSVARFADEQEATSVVQSDGGRGPVYVDLEDKTLTNFYKSLGSVGSLVVKVTVDETDAAICKQDHTPVLLDLIMSRISTPE